MGGITKEKASKSSGRTWERENVHTRIFVGDKEILNKICEDESAKRFVKVTSATILAELLRGKYPNYFARTAMA